MIAKDSTVWDFEMWLLAVLIGDRINDQGFFDKKMYGHFAGPKKWPRRMPCQATPPQGLEEDIRTGSTVPKSPLSTNL